MNGMIIFGPSKEFLFQFRFISSDLGLIQKNPSQYRNSTTVGQSLPKHTGKCGRPFIQDTAHSSHTHFIFE